MAFPSSPSDGDKMYQNREWLKREYVEKDRTARDISEDFDCTRRNITYFIDKFNLKKKIPKYHNEKWLRKQKIELNKSDKEIAEEEGTHRKVIGRWRHKYNIPKKDTTGKNNGNWNGGRCKTRGHWRINIPDGGRMAEHRYVMEKKLGREIKSNEIVHHIDCDGFNNDLDNLVLLNKSEHRKVHSSITDLIKPLIERGIIYYDKEDKRYKLEDE